MKGCATSKIIAKKKSAADFFNEELDANITGMIQEMKVAYKKKYKPDISKGYAKPPDWGAIRRKINEALKVRKDFDL